MSMTVKRISDLVKAGLIPVKDPSKGFTIRDLVEGYMKLFKILKNFRKLEVIINN